MPKILKYIALFVLATAVFTGVFYVTNSHAFFASKKSDWEVRCDENKQGEAYNCEIFQRLVAKESQQRIAEFAVTKNAESNQYRAAVILPLGVHIPSGVSLEIDSTVVGKASVNHCTNQGCFVYVNLSINDLIGKMRAGDKATFEFMGAKGNKFRIDFSLKGFSKDLEMIS